MKGLNKMRQYFICVKEIKSLCKMYKHTQMYALWKMDICVYCLLPSGTEWPDLTDCLSNVPSRSVF